MIKTMLLILLWFFPVSLIDMQAFVESPDSVPPRLAIEYVAVQPADSSEYPPSYLLQKALAGYEILVEDSTISRPEVITLIDFSLQSDRRRLWVLDLKQGKVLFHCLVSHGRNSGELKAENFSNTPGSNASSPGFYVTGETYIGKNGLSLALDGLERGINDKARQRSIVIHGADYVSDDFIRAHGRLGRSQGCPAVPVELTEDIIKTIKGGSCLFIYSPKSDNNSNPHIIRKVHPTSKT